MKSHLLLLAGAALLVSGCGTAPRDGSEQQAHYYAFRAAPASGVTTVHAGPSEAASTGPGNSSHIVYFAFDDDSLQPQYQKIVETHGEFLRANKDRQVVLEGHTDERGGTEYNLALGQRRAETVNRALRMMGVSSAQLEAVSFGEEKPASMSRTEQGYQLNRRVEFRYR